MPDAGLLHYRVAKEVEAPWAERPFGFSVFSCVWSPAPTVADIAGRGSPISVTACVEPSKKDFLEEERAPSSPNLQYTPFLAPLLAKSRIIFLRIRAARRAPMHDG